MEYIPILRLRQTESKILKEINGKTICPLLEIVDSKSFQSFTAKNYKFSKDLMIDLPIYLTEEENRYYVGVTEILDGVNGASKQLKQAEFYKSNAKNIGIPVVSSKSIKIRLDYNDLLIGYNALDKTTFPKIAIRIFVNSIDLSPKNIASFKSLLSAIRDEDLLLFDVVEFDGVEQGAMNNLNILLALLSEKLKERSFILNAFDITSNWRSDVHHYAPVLSKLFGLGGFGDFATMPRHEDAGGASGTTSVIRYTIGWEDRLTHFASPSFQVSSTTLKNAQVWADAKTNGHFNMCNPCKQIDTKNTEWKTFWKMFRIEHHINTMLSNTLPNILKYKNPQDFDIDGWDAISKKGNFGNG
jgi:hypothetical protein